MILPGMFSVMYVPTAFFVTYIIHFMLNGIHNNEFEAKIRSLFQSFCVNCLRILRIFLKLLADLNFSFPWLQKKV